MDYDNDFFELSVACQSSKMFPEVGDGLQNLRNTCFANATVQLLINCPDFHRHLMSHKESGIQLDTFVKFTLNCLSFFQ